MTEDEIVGWHHQLNEREFELALAVDGQGSLACYSPWGHKELDMTERLNWTENLFSAVLSLRCSVLAFSSFDKQRLLCSCSGFSCCSAGALEPRL